MFGGGTFIVWGCFSHDNKLYLKVVTLTISLSLSCIQISEHIKQHTPYFKTTLPSHIGHVWLQILLHRRGLKIFSWRARVLSKSPDMNPIEHVWNHIGRNVCTWNDVVTLDDLVRGLVDEWNNSKPRYVYHSQFLVLHFGENFMKIRTEIPTLQMHENNHKMWMKTCFHHFNTIYTIFYEFLWWATKAINMFELYTADFFYVFNPLKMAVQFFSQFWWFKCLFPLNQQAPSPDFRKVVKSQVYNVE